MCDGMAGSGSRWGQERRTGQDEADVGRVATVLPWPRPASLAYPDRVRHHMSRPRGAPYRLRATWSHSATPWLDYA